MTRYLSMALAVASAMAGLYLSPLPESHLSVTALSFLYLFVLA